MPHRLLHKLFDEEDSDALVAERGRNVENAIDDDRGESARGLIEDEEPGIADDSLSDRKYLLLAAAEARRELVPPLRHFRKHRIDALKFRSVAAGGPCIGAKQKVVLNWP